MAKVSKLPKGTSVHMAQNDVDRFRLYRFRYRCWSKNWTTIRPGATTRI